jgi:hypothetical protein
MIKCRLTLNTVSTQCASTITVNDGTSDWNAIAGSDYTLSNDTLTFAFGFGQSKRERAERERPDDRGRQPINLRSSDPTNVALGPLLPCPDHS